MMKTITLWQPWASLKALDEKRNETRSWYTGYRGPLAIHAATNVPPAVKHLFHEDPFCSTLKTETVPLGSVIAICNLVDCLYIASDGLREYDPKRPIRIGEIVFPLPAGNELAFGDYTPGRFTWITDSTYQLAEPITAKGHQSLWNWDEIPHLVTIDPYKVGPTKIWTPRGIMRGRLVTDQAAEDEDYVRGLEVV